MACKQVTDGEFESLQRLPSGACCLQQEHEHNNVHGSLTLQNVSCREDQLEGDAKLKLAVLAGQLVALREGLGNTLTSLRLCHVPVPTAASPHC